MAGKFGDIGVRLVVKDFAKFNRQLSMAGMSITSLGRGAKSLGASFSVANLAFGAAVVGITAVIAGVVALGSAMVNLTSDSLKMSIDVESDFASIAKVVTETELLAGGKLTEAGARLKEEFIQLSRDIPATLEDLMRIGTIGGQTGIEADQLKGFTETIAKLAITTDLTAEQAAQSMATLAKIFGVESENMVKWIATTGSGLVALGNTFATNEPKILAYAERVAGVASAVGFTRSDIMALGAVFSQAGVQAQRGGTAMQKTMVKISQAIVNGGEQLDLFASVSGKTAKQFSEDFKEDASGAFLEFIRGLESEGANAVAVLEDLELGDQRLIAAFLAIAGDSGQLEEAFDLADLSVETTDALEREFDIFAETTESRLMMIKNDIISWKILFGDAFKESIFSPFVEAFDDASAEIGQEMPGVIEGIFKKIDTKLKPALEGLLTTLGLDDVDWGQLTIDAGLFFEQGIEDTAKFIDNIDTILQIFQEGGTWQEAFDAWEFSVPEPKNIEDMSQFAIDLTNIAASVEILKEILGTDSIWGLIFQGGKDDGKIPFGQVISGDSNWITDILATMSGFIETESPRIAEVAGVFFGAFFNDETMEWEAAKGFAFLADAIIRLTGELIIGVGGAAEEVGTVVIESAFGVLYSIMDGLIAEIRVKINAFITEVNAWLNNQVFFGEIFGDIPLLTGLGEAESNVFSPEIYNYGVGTTGGPLEQPQSVYNLDVTYLEPQDEGSILDDLQLRDAMGDSRGGR